MDTRYKYARNNSKLAELAKMLNLKKSEVVGFDMPAGFTCPAAKLCAAYSNKETGKITRGKHAEFLCYASKLEAAFPAARKAHWHNFETIQSDFARFGWEWTAEYIAKELSAMKVKVVRIHTSGDFFHLEYFLMWTYIARLLPGVSFFGYTKIMTYAVQFRPEFKAANMIPDNFSVVYSVGGKYDTEAPNYPGLATSTVVPTKADAIDPIACSTPTSPDDYNFIMRYESFSLALH